MEAKVCDLNHLGADVLLPPRKRLLAGFKKQNFEIDTNWHASCIESSSSIASRVFDSHLNSLLNSHTNESNLSPEEIVEASGSAAVAAAKAAKAARALAEEKAAIAAKAVAAAKTALDIVASFSEASGSNDRYLKRNKMKHVPVNSLYGKEKSKGNCKADEELARNLHRAMNSSPRKRKCSQGADANIGRSKKPQYSSTDEVDCPKSSGHADSDEVDSEGTIDDAATSQTKEKSFKYVSNFRSKMLNGESSHSTARAWDDGSPSTKRGRVKLKKLPLSICTY
ncbi:hypothetical protein MLD38_004752 [Melastoma candidum]|uniref:Uncharacterized protein n=1 Tax=Melastoma candidum TaxID=119954 RepID=A0ACB9S6T4_9MYRT|nr:hypothetical protein MLD38_004752 [Melastoma candidum]